MWNALLASIVLRLVLTCVTMGKAMSTRYHAHHHRQAEMHLCGISCANTCRMNRGRLTKVTIWGNLIFAIRQIATLFQIFLMHIAQHTLQ